MKKSMRLITGITWIITLILLFSTFGCEKDNTASIAAIDQAREAIDAAWLAEDADVILAHSADNMILMPPNVGSVKGKEAIRDFLQGFFDHFTMTELETVKRNLHIAGDWAIEEGLYEWVIVPEGASEGMSDQINFIGIWQLQPDGSWKETRMIWNSTKPIAAVQ